jgi:hypothetical protein
MEDQYVIKPQTDEKTMQESRFRLVKPTLQTPFHIDFEWWKQNDRSWQVYLKSYLSEEIQETLRVAGDEQLIDIIDPETGEVHQVEALQHLLILHYADRDDFITGTTTVTEAIFRLLLSNGNAPLTPIELGERLGREPGTVLRMLSGPRTYKGIRPLLTN